MSHRLTWPLVAAVLTSAIVAAIGLAGQSTTQGVGQPPAPTGQSVGQLTLEPGGTAIPIYSYSFGASAPVTVGGGGTSASKVSFSSLNLMKPVDSSSVGLLSAVSRGTHFATITFTAQWGAGTAAATWVYELEDALIESDQHSGSGGSPATESLSIAFSKVTWTYTDSTGTTSGSWNIATNSP